MSCDKQDFRLEETPHIFSVTVTSGGSGYTWARAKVVGGGGKNARLSCVISGGEITEILIVFPGYKFTSQPTISITGDGFGATAEAVIGGGVKVFENTTMVDNPSCAEGCLPTGDPCEPVSTAPTTRDYCDPGSYSNVTEPDGTNARTCHINTCGIPDPIPANTYAEKSPPEFVDYSACQRTGYKVAFAMKEWPGMWGWLGKGDGQTKYLSIEQSATATSSTAQRNAYAERSYKYSTERCTGNVTVDFEDSDESCSSSPSDLPLPCGCPLSLAETVNDLIANMKPDPSGNFPESPSGWTVVSSANDTSFSWQGTYEGLDAECGETTTVLTSSGTMSNPYSAGDVMAEARALLATIDLCDDEKFPWRTDEADFGNSHWTPQLGPSFGPLATCHDVVTSNPAGYEPFWDFARSNKHYSIACGQFGASQGWYSVNWGAACPAKYGTATNWMPDMAGNIMLRGSNAIYNSVDGWYYTCGNGAFDHCAEEPESTGKLWLDAGTFWCSKWAEIHDFNNGDNSYGVTRELLKENETISRVETGGTLDTPCSSAIFIQDEPLTGKYVNALQIPAAQISEFDDTCLGSGYSARVTFDQPAEVLPP